MSFKKLTISYDDFQDEENGLVPYLASAIMMLIRKDDMDGLQELMNNIAKVADMLFDLNDEAVAKKKDYDKLQNRLAAIRADREKKEAAEAAIQEQMLQLIGREEEEYSDTLEPASARDISEIVADAAVEYDPLSELDLVLGDFDSDDMSGLSELTVEKVMTNQHVPEALRKAGIVFGDEIGKLATKHEEEIEELEDDVYADFDLQIEDVDQGYVPVPDDSPKKKNDPGDLFVEEPAVYDEEDDYSEYDDDYDDFDIFSDSPGYDSSPVSSSEDTATQDDEYEEIDFDEDFVEDGYLESADDIFAPPPSEPSNDFSSDDDDMTSGIVDLDLFN